MTPEKTAELVKRLRLLVFTEGLGPIADLGDDAAAAIESLQASVANAERRAEDAEARLEFARIAREVGDAIADETIEKLKDGIAFIQLHQSKRRK